VVCHAKTNDGITASGSTNPVTFSDIRRGSGSATWRADRRTAPLPSR